MSWSDVIAARSLADHAESPYLSLCDHLAVIRASGEEAGHYLQGQLSCDLREVDQGAHLTGMHLSLKPVTSRPHPLHPPSYYEVS